MNSVIGIPESGDTVRVGPDETLEVKGYALPHGPDGPFVKVEVSVDDGISWHEAELSDDLEGGGRWTWVLWQARVKLSVGKKEGFSARQQTREATCRRKTPCGI